MRIMLEIKQVPCAAQDKDGDVLVLLPDQPWQHFVADACCVIVSCK